MDSGKTTIYIYIYIYMWPCLPELVLPEVVFAFAFAHQLFGHLLLHECLDALPERGAL